MNDDLPSGNLALASRDRLRLRRQPRHRPRRPAEPDHRRARVAGRRRPGRGGRAGEAGAGGCRSGSRAAGVHRLPRGRQAGEDAEAVPGHALRSDAGEYRRRWGLPNDYPMVAPAYAESARRWPGSSAWAASRRAPAEPEPVPSPSPLPCRRPRQRPAQQRRTGGRRKARRKARSSRPSLSPSAAPRSRPRTGVGRRHVSAVAGRLRSGSVRPPWCRPRRQARAWVTGEAGRRWRTGSRSKSGG
jgi:hypothetical protein